MAVYPLAYSYIPISPNPAFPSGRIAPRPILKLTLLNHNKQLSCYALVDSGADHCVFPRSFMAPLGLDALSSPIERTAGVGGTGVPTHFANVEIDLGAIGKLAVYAGFTVGLEPIGLGLLGQTGFFDRLNIHFKLAAKTCFIERT